MHRHITDLLHLPPNKVWRIRKTCYEMIADRGYEVKTEDAHFFPNDETGFYEWLLEKKEEKELDDKVSKTQVLELKSKALRKKNALRKELKHLKDKREVEVLTEKIENVTRKCNLKCQELQLPFEKTLTIRAHNGKRTLAILFLTGEKLVQRTLTDCIQYRDSEKIDDLLLILALGYTPAIKTHLQSYGKKTIRSWTYTDLLFNITHHKLVPRHEGQTPAQKTAFLEARRMKPDQLSILCKDDPIARYFHFVPNQLVKILRPSETAGTFETYRIVK